LVLVGLLLSFSLLPLAAVEAQTGERCFRETGFCISGRIRTFWEQNGGLPVFGLPIAPQQEESIEGKPFQVQWFERNRLELHPENARPYDVLLGRLGVDRLAQQGRDWFSLPKSEPQANCRFFPETGHNICGDILAAWHASGLELDGRQGKSEAENLALFGLPLSDAQPETIEGKEYSIQWFERGRFELHPENQSPYNVLLGLLGTEIHGIAAPPQPPPASGGSWKVSLTGAHEASEVRCDVGTGTLTIKPTEGYAFLVIDLKLLNLRKGEQAKLTNADLVVVGSDGSRYTADSAGSPGEPPCLNNFTIYFYDDERPITLLFVPRKDLIGRPFRLEIPGAPPITVTAKAI
jgi:hypothetical protein